MFHSIKLFAQRQLTEGIIGAYSVEKADLINIGYHGAGKIKVDSESFM